MPISKAGISTDQRGFTLAELAVVVFIIALAATLAIPMLGGDRQSQVNSAGRKLAGLIKYCYNEAALSGSLHRLNLNLERNTLAGERRDQDGEWRALSGAAREQRLPDSVSIKEVFIGGQGSSTSGTVTLHIYPAGWVDDTVIHLERGSAQLTLRVSSLTGTTEFFDGHREFR